MGHDDVHELTAAYALDALDEAEAHEYEQHLRDCPRCRDDLRELSGAAASLAYAAPAPPPPPALRERLLEDVRRERATVIPLRSRRPFLAGAGLAAVAACAAIALGLWAFSLQSSLDEERRANRAQQTAIELISDPIARRAALSGDHGTLIVGRERSGLLVLSPLESAPEGKDYEAWVATEAELEPAGIFEGGTERIVRLTKPVPPGATVMVTLEDEGGVASPEGKPLFRAST